MVIIEHVHKFLEDLLVFAVHAHVHLLVILGKGLFFALHLAALPVGRGRDGRIERLILVARLLRQLLIGL